MWREASALASASSKTVLLFIAGFLGLASPSPGAPAEAAASVDPLVGLWRVYDEQGTKARTLVRIAGENGNYVGTVERLLPAGADPERRCASCIGDRKDRRVLGMTVLWSTKRDGGQVHGRVLDPDNGVTCRSTLTLAEDGTKIEISGESPDAIQGARTQIWVRH